MMKQPIIQIVKTIIFDVTIIIIYFIIIKFIIIFF